MANTENRQGTGSAGKESERRGNVEVTNRSGESNTSMSRRENPGSQSLSRRDDFGQSFFGRSPFETMRRMSEQMDRMLSSFGLGRGWLAPTFGSGLFGDYGGLSETGDRGSLTNWSPDVEVFRRADELVVRADVPGLDREDLHVEMRGDSIVIDGERREQKEDERGGYHYSERRYGHFHREIPLPEGINAEQAKASFKDGVLEVTMPAPPQEGSRGRELPIQ